MLRGWRLVAVSAFCGAAYIELALETAAHGCCVAQKRQRHGGRFVVFGWWCHQNCGLLGVLRRSGGGIAASARVGGVARWCGLMPGQWRRCRRRRRARRDSRCDFGAALERRVYGAARKSWRQLGRAACVCGRWRRCRRCRALCVRRPLRRRSAVLSCAW